MLQCQYCQRSSSAVHDQVGAAAPGPDLASRKIHVRDAAGSLRSHHCDGDANRRDPASAVDAHRDDSRVEPGIHRRFGRKVALPAIGRSYAASATELQWTINAYLLPLSALLLIGGAAGDHYGRRRLLIAGTVIFTLASIGCAIAPSLTVLLIARALQGVGAAMLMPNSLAILGSAFGGEAKGRAIGTWAAAGSIASAAGPPIGGWLIDVVGWRAIFLLNVPLAAAAIAIAWLSWPRAGKASNRWTGRAPRSPR